MACFPLRAQGLSHPKKRQYRGKKWLASPTQKVESLKAYGYFAPLRARTQEAEFLDPVDLLAEYRTHPHFAFHLPLKEAATQRPCRSRYTIPDLVDLEFAKDKRSLERRAQFC